ncbi:hypothetical protein M1L60_04610 [Actinoplanes sp. TRM 88003]|uniref:Secreted protein n=1 Tax=Paractinoplanes aksuensis TaxID=2939490 RepID=A0ABT1DGA7_9ACTN|nr:hypothetical protein [Actinoplanes aksuensis]MCO8269873.1 hypothetical protein [Actinoplanes aksuensis]
MTTTGEITRRWGAATLMAGLLTGGGLLAGSAAASGSGVAAVFGAGGAPISGAGVAAIDAGAAAAPVGGNAVVPGGGGAAAAVGAAVCTRLVTPATAGAGEWIPILAYRHRDRKGPLEIRFDGQPVSYRLLRHAGSCTPRATEIFLVVGVPSGVAHGRHEIQLYEPARTPGRPPERIAVSTIMLGP